MSTKYQAKTVREVIAELQSWHDQDQKIAWTVFTKYDIEGDEEYYELPSLDEAWNTIADGVQEMLSEGFYVEQLNEGIREITEEHYDLKEV